MSFSAANCSNRPEGVLKLSLCNANESVNVSSSRAEMKLSSAQQAQRLSRGGAVTRIIVDMHVHRGGSSLFRRPILQLILWDTNSNRILTWSPPAPVQSQLPVTPYSEVMDQHKKIFNKSGLESHNLIKFKMPTFSKTLLESQTSKHCVSCRAPLTLHVGGGGASLPLPMKRRFSCQMWFLSETIFCCGHSLSAKPVAVSWISLFFLLLLQIMSDSVKNVAIFGATGMTGLATMPQAVAAGEQLKTERQSIKEWIRCQEHTGAFGSFNCSTE